MILIHNFICGILLFSGFLVAFSVNPIQSVLFLITTFCSAGALLILFHSEFFGLTFIIVYVGAIAVLFLFVVMMLNVKNMEDSSFFFKNKNVEILTLIFLFYILFIILSKNSFKFFVEKNLFITNNFVVDQFTNIQILGQTLYNYYFVCFLFAGLVLLVALIGAVVLTLKFNELNKSQLASRQLSRSDKFLTFFV
jgi:NADH-quinone oxidoreductase subunit J